MKVHDSFSPIAYIFSSFLLFGSCINTDYDLSKEVDKEIVVGAGGIIMPLGNTEPITLNKFIYVSEGYAVEDVFKLSHTETIDGISWGNSILDNKGDIRVELSTTIENTIPLEFKLGANVFSENGERLEGIVVDEGNIKRGSLECISYTEVVLKMLVPETRLKQIHTIDILIEGEGKIISGDVELNEDQYLQMNDMSIIVRGGLDVEF